MRITIKQILDMKKRGERIPVLTAYDYSTAKFLDAAGIPMILVGDSLGMVILGYETTIPVTMEDMIHHGKAVVRGSKQALVIMDLPFMSYQSTADDAVRNAGRLIKETSAQAVKLEGGRSMIETIRRIIECGIPVQGHIGLTPQSINQLGGYRVVGKSSGEAKRLMDDALALQEAGVFSIVLETIPAQLAEKITAQLSVPTIGIGAGAHCDGQVQVLHDILGLYTDFVPKHTKHFADLGKAINTALQKYIEEIRNGTFPSEAQSFFMKEEALKALDD
jgi:3-methyl-2-oxobutanoate hydroxymethyltransferase